jgi:predicted ABC-type sugar transport system permease subunit
MSRTSTPEPPTSAAGVGTADTAARRTWLGFLIDRPLIVLTAVLVVLILVTGLIEPRYLSLRGLRNTLLLAAPIGIMAAGQTVLMLTRGIDLSVAMVATLAAYVLASQAPGGLALAILLALAVGAAVRARPRGRADTAARHPQPRAAPDSSLFRRILHESPNRFWRY